MNPTLILELARTQCIPAARRTPRDGNAALSFAASVYAAAVGPGLDGFEVVCDPVLLVS